VLSEFCFPCRNNKINEIYSIHITILNLLNPKYLGCYSLSLDLEHTILDCRVNRYRVLQCTCIMLLKYLHNFKKLKS